nr:DNA replication/repair protein RecF [Bacteroidota bacterium]
MFLKELSLFQFKNYRDANIQLHQGVNCFAGNNGSGKTNLLDAIYYLSMTKSYLQQSDIQNILHAQPQAMIKGVFQHLDEEKEILCLLRREQKKVVKLNQTEYEKLSDHIGLMPVVMLSPMDHELITGGSEVRRKFIDSIISQCDAAYLQHLIQYNKVLLQRNALLKLHSRQGVIDYTIYEIYDTQLDIHGTAIHNKRNDFFGIFNELFLQACHYIAPETEAVAITYQSTIGNQSIKELLERNFKKDLALEYTHAGIHKDDWDFTINNYSVKKFGSQGQQKTFLVALKLAQYQYIQLMKNIQPILMLDDIYDKLDDTRLGKLMQMVSEHKFGQIFITDTNIKRIENIFLEMGEPLRKFHVSNGEVEMLK